MLCLDSSHGPGFQTGIIFNLKQIDIWRNMFFAQPDDLK